MTSGAALAELMGATLVSLEGAGHGPHGASAGQGERADPRLCLSSETRCSMVERHATP